MKETQSPGLDQQSNGKAGRVLISLLVGALVGGESGVIAFLITLGLIVAVVFVAGTRLQLGAEPAFFMLLALPFYLGLPVSLSIALLVGSISSFLIYKKGLSWFDSRDRRTKRLLLAGAVLGVLATCACTSLALLAYANTLRF